MGSFATSMRTACGGSFDTDCAFMAGRNRGPMTPYAHAPFVGFRFVRRCP